MTWGRTVPVPVGPPLFERQRRKTTCYTCDDEGRHYVSKIWLCEACINGEQHAILNQVFTCYVCCREAVSGRHADNGARLCKACFDELQGAL